MNKNNKFARAKIIAFRVYHLEMGLPPLIESIENKTNLEIAEEQYNNGLLYFHYTYAV